MTELHNLYKEKCAEQNHKPLSKQILVDEFSKMNLSLFSPRKDQCDICVQHEEGNLSDDLWNAHIEKKDRARDEKSRDKKEALESMNRNGDKIMVVCMDLQAVLLSPSLQASALFYKTKLCVHNFTIYNMCTSDAVCYVWHEGEGGLTASEFCTCVCDFLTENIESFDSIILWSDGCGYQNRNVILTNALMQFAKEHNKSITQKILEKGHTQMEVDSVHAKIEQRLKPRSMKGSKRNPKKIFCPADYVEEMKMARSVPSPYRVKYVDHNFFKNYTEVGNLKSIRPGKKAGDPTVTDLRALRYTPTGVQYKLDHSDNWMQQSDHIREPPATRVVPLYTDKIAIGATKYGHLQQLKSVMPKDYHSFYDNLRK